MSLEKPQNTVSVQHFRQDDFPGEVQNLCNGFDVNAIGQQVIYLANYLGSLETRTLVIESFYIDRHYIEGSSHYYSRCLVPRSHSTSRIHAFSTSFTESDFHSIIIDSCGDYAEHAKAQLQADYLGYIVIRPIPSVPIGRTVLSTLQDSPERTFNCLVTYDVHLCGLDLTVTGLAFQQQDRAVAACATTATWSALQRVCRNEGSRAPTPLEITESAVEHFLPEGRPYPSKGLSTEQISDALRASKYPPVIMRVGDKPDRFLLMLNAYLRSGIPVILGITDGENGHAVTAVGYRIDEHIDCNFGLDGDITVNNLMFKEIYLHDDRLGPYARAILKYKRNYFLLRCSKVGLSLEVELPDGSNEDWDVSLGIVPMYKKLRTSADELITTMAEAAPIIDGIFGDYGDTSVTLHFERCGQYLKSILEYDIVPERYTHLVTNAVFSRYLAVVRWYIDEMPIIDFVWDTTDTLRSETSFESGLLAIVALCAEEEVLDYVDFYCSFFNAISG